MVKEAEYLAGRRSDFLTLRPLFATGGGQMTTLWMAPLGDVPFSTYGAPQGILPIMLYLLNSLNSQIN